MSDKEYGIARRNEPLEEGVHCSNMTLEEAKEWIKEWEEMNGVPGVFYIVKRTLSPWEAL